MAKEICISSTPHETRLAVLEDDQLAEIYYERENEYTLAGSIYNGRVTRVLPGMQSAFVDLGLERDAFLYVTDFIELEDQAEAEELEHAAASGAALPPREVRHSGGRQRGGRPEQREDRRTTEEAETIRIAPEAVEAAPAGGEPAEPEPQSEDESGTPSGRRWRGRRHRRGRSPGTAAAERPEEAAAESRGAQSAPFEAPMEPELAADIHAAAHAAGVSAGSRRREHHAPSAPAAFVLPGESISKYGGTAAPETARPAAERPPATPLATSRPSTLIEAPLEWDGSGLLPGESLSLHRQHRSQPLPDEDTIESTLEAGTEMTSETAAEAETADEETAAGDLFPEREDDLPEHEPSEFEPEPGTGLATDTEPEPDPEGSTLEEDDAAFASPEAEPVETEPFEAEPDTSASHRVDPHAPSGFRLFGMGGKRKPEPSEPPAQRHAEPAAPVATTTSYAPGAGLVEEEVIEGEEYDPVPHHQRHGSEPGQLDDYEEETLASQIRSGNLGEMLQEAHLDHRIDLSLGNKNGDEEVDIEEEEGEEPAAEGLPAPGHPHRERGGRTRRGRAVPGRSDRRAPSRRSVQSTEVPIITDLLKPGQEILVQIAKEPIAKKGARITSHIALPGRFLVYMPTVTHVGVSRKIASDEERHRLKRILIHERGEAPGGFIVRTAAEGASEEELRADLRFLIHLWEEIKQRSDASQSPALIYHDLSLIERILRDQVSANFSNIWVDSEADYERIVRFLNRFSPSLVRRVKLYTKETPLFEHFGIQDEISKALRSKVWLKSGGSIVINQTEALVAIDINTGKYVGKSARLEDTILKTNLDAVPEIVRQIRLRDLGGIIVIDFIDMDERKNRFKVMAALEEALKSDRAPTKVLQFNDFGLVAITRKRVKQSLERTLSVPCPTCQATGMVKSPATVCNEIWVEMRKMRKHFEGADVMLRVHPETVKVLKSGSGRWLSELEELAGKNILVKSDPTLHPEQFDIQG